MGILLYAEIGILTIPGVIMALVGIFLIVKDKVIELAVICVLTATGSFFAQYVTVFCMYCTIAATLFALTGIFSLLVDKAKHPKIAITLIVVLMAGLFSLNSVFYFYQNPIIEHNGIVYAKKSEEKPLLYISPTCKGCTLLLEEIIEYDSSGKNWMPVSIPYRSLNQSEKMLKEMGYTGEIQVSGVSPTGFVPVLFLDENTILRGEEIIKFIKESGR